jgi:hypothetical protein
MTLDQRLGKLSFRTCWTTHTDAPVHIRQHAGPFSAATLTFVVAMMARHDVLDLTKACPKIVKQHPHVRLNFITLASVGELEATESAFSRHLAINADSDSSFVGETAL